MNTVNLGAWTTDSSSSLDTDCNSHGYVSVSDTGQMCLCTKPVACDGFSRAEKLKVIKVHYFTPDWDS